MQKGTGFSASPFSLSKMGEQLGNRCLILLKRELKFNCMNDIAGNGYALHQRCNVFRRSDYLLQVEQNVSGIARTFAQAAVPITD